MLYLEFKKSTFIFWGSVGPEQHKILLVWPYSCNKLYIYMCTKKIVIERTRDLIYLKFVATDFFLKIISPSAGENSGDLA